MRNWWPKQPTPQPEFSIEVDLGNGVSFSATGSEEHVITAFAWFMDLMKPDSSQESAVPELPALRAQKVGTC